MEPREMMRQMPTLLVVALFITFILIAVGVQ